MRFMMIMIPNVSEENWAPNADEIATMSKFNDELAKAGILLALDGLAPTAKGARVSRSPPANRPSPTVRSPRPRS